MRKILKDKRGEMHPLFIRNLMGAVCVIILVSVGVSVIKDKQSEIEYQNWARAENQKVFDTSQQIRLNEKQLLKIKRELNDSFYQRLENDLPVRVLIVGDAYGNGFGSSNKSAVWSKLLQSGLKKKFGVKVEVENLTLSGMNGGYGAWARLMSLPDGNSQEVLTSAGAVKDKQGLYTGEGVDSKTVAASRENEYDLCIVSLGMTDEPRMFELYYEGVLREVRRKFEKCSIISLLSNQALTAPELGYADDNYDALYRISGHYGASVLNVGLEIADPDAAEKGATMSQIPYGTAASESLAADMRADGISEKKVNEISSKDLAERSAAGEAAIKKYTIEGLYLNNEGQKFLSERLLHLIEKKVSKSTGYDDKEVAPLKQEVATLDQYHYFPASELVRLDDFTYVLAENRVKEAIEAGAGNGGAGNTGAGGAGKGGVGVDGAGSVGVGSAAADGNGGVNANPAAFGSIVGVDYDLLSGHNDIYAAVHDGTVGFGRITQNYESSSKERFINPLNEGYSYEKDGNLILSFSTKKQADTLHGVILGGDFTLPSYFDGYQQVPYVGLTDKNGNPVALDKDGKPKGQDSSGSESSAAAETTAAETKAADTTVKQPAAPVNPVPVTMAPEASTFAETAGAAETTASTFGNDQPAQGNAEAVSESYSNMSENQPTADNSGVSPEAQQAADNSAASSDSGTESYPEAGVVYIHDDSEEAGPDSGSQNTSESDAFAYEIGNPARSRIASSDEDQN